MSRASFLILIAATIVTVIASVVLVVSEQASAIVPDPGGDSVFPELTARLSELDRVVIEAPRYRLVLENRGGRWVDAGRGDYPARTEPIAQLITSLAAMTTVEPKTDNPNLYDVIGVGGPTATGQSTGLRVIAQAINGDTLIDAILGRQSLSIPYARAGGTFVRRSDETQAWLVEGTAAVPGFLQEWFDPIVQIPGTEVARMAILIGDQLVFEAEKVDFATGNYELTFLREDVGPAGATANDDGIRSVTQALASTNFDDARLLETVVFAADARTLRFVTRTGLRLDVRLGQADGETWVAYTATAEPGSAAAADAQAITARTDRWAFKLPQGRIAAFNRALTELYDPPAGPALPGQQPAPRLPIAPF